jgi:hypothetical protein
MGSQSLAAIFKGWLTLFPHEQNEVGITHIHPRAANHLTIQLDSMLL